MNTVCNYCELGYKNDYIINTATKMSRKRDFYPGISVGIEDNNLFVVSSSDTYEPGFQEESIKINFCPMCGRELVKE